MKKDSRLRIFYWIATILFALWLVGDGLGGVLQVEAGKTSLAHLGYPMYFLLITGFAKLCAAVAIVQTRYTTIKEWAYAGYAFNCLGAFLSRAFVGDNFALVLLPLIFLGIMFIPYLLWRKVRQGA